MMELQRTVLLVVVVAPLIVTAAPKAYDMDNYATCVGGRTLIVDDSGIILFGRGSTAPSNPPLECTVYLLSTYRENDGTNKLQMEVQNVKSVGCEVNINVYNGRTTSGATLQTLGCDQYGKTGIFYSTTNELTVHMTRPDRIVHNEYQFTLVFKPWKDPNAMETDRSVDSLSVGAIIGIIIGCLIVVGIIILFCWCCCTGRLGNFNIPGRTIKTAYVESTEKTGSATYVSSGGRGKGLNLDDPDVWNTVTTGKYQPGRNSQRYQNGQQPVIGRRFDRSEAQSYRDQDDKRQSGHDYEPYDIDTRQGQSDYGRYQNQGRSAIRDREARQSKKETLIDDVFDSESNQGSEKTGDTDVDDATLQKRTHDADSKVPEEEQLPQGSPQLERYTSMDLASQPDHDTISSPLHINAGVRASVDDEAGSPSGSLRRKNKSPKSKRKDQGKTPDPMAPPPEAFEPIFTKPISGIDYQGSNRNLYPQPQGFPGGFIPYGFIPAGGFAPGTQTYAYAYQTVPHQGAPGQQGAWFVQNTPTTDGNRRTAFAVQETISPDKRSTPERKRRKNSDPFRKGGNKGGNDPNPDLSIIARGAAPPNPGQGHRSIEMKSATDPDTKVHTTQVLWTDTVPDPTDPKPGENPQITRKTMTRVTTKSGHRELPQHGTLMALDDADPAFLNPSSRSPSHQPAIMAPPATSPANENLAFYTGHSALPPERSSTPTSSVHNKPAYNAAIRDRIPFDSTV